MSHRVLVVTVSPALACMPTPYHLHRDHAALHICAKCTLRDITTMACSLPCSASLAQYHRTPQVVKTETHLNISSSGGGISLELAKDAIGAVV